MNDTASAPALSGASMPADGWAQIEVAVREAFGETAQIVSYYAMPAEAHRYPIAYITVTVKGRNRPLVASTHEAVIGPNGALLQHGHYDMTEPDAIEDFLARVGQYGRVKKQQATTSETERAL